MFAVAVGWCPVGLCCLMATHGDLSWEAELETGGNFKVQVGSKCSTCLRARSIPRGPGSPGDTEDIGMWHSSQIKNCVW